MIEPKPLPFSKQLEGISEKTLATHHDKLYVGYINKAKEIWQKLEENRSAVVLGEKPGNQIYSELRGLKNGETFAVNAIYLHEWYFDVLGGSGATTEAPELSKAIAESWGSVDDFMKYMSECGMAARGWVVLAWDTRLGKLMLYSADAHNQGGVWGCLPVIVLDVYEHAYFIDYGSDRKSYIQSYWKNFNWTSAENLFLRARAVSF